VDAFILLSSAEQYVLTRFFVFKYLTPWKDILVLSFTLLLIRKSCTLMPIHEVSAGVMTAGGCPISLEELSDRVVSKDVFMKIVFITFCTPLYLLNLKKTIVHFLYFYQYRCS
jgi:hypothetical protein